MYQEAASPLTSTHYLGSTRGAIYSADHNLERFHAETIAKNRCDTPVKNLYISGMILLLLYLHTTHRVEIYYINKYINCNFSVSGQDVFSCGIIGAMHGGLLCASAVLNQIIYIDLFLLKKKLKRDKAKEMARLCKPKVQ